MATRHAARTGSDDIYFVVGNVDEDTVFMQEGDVEVYSLLTAQSDDSAQVFFLSGGTIKTVAYKGTYIKSTDTVSISPRHASGGFTAIHLSLRPGRPTRLIRTVHAP